MRFFLSAKAWQMFIVLFGTMFIIPMSVPLFEDPITVMGVGSLLFMVLFFAWLCAIAIKANHRLEPELRRSPRWMLAGLAYALVYVVGVFMTLPAAMGTGAGFPRFILPLHLLAMFSIFYAMMFTARQLVTVQHKAKVAFFEYSGAFFLLWFFPIGVWFIQPKVNQLLMKKGD